MKLMETGKDLTEKFYLQMRDRNSVLIFGVKSMRECSENEVSVRDRCGKTITVYGEELRCSAFTENIIEVCGRIGVIDLGGGRR